MNNLKEFTFNEADSEWQQFVRDNSSGAPMHGYDFVEGAMLGNPKPFMNGAEQNSFRNQISFHTQDAIDLLMKGLKK